MNADSVVRWSVGGIFLEALTDRDFGRLAATLDPGVRLRAILPRGPIEHHGGPAVAGFFESRFGAASDLELVDATVGEVGGRLHLSWRLRLRPAPIADGDGWHVIEQHVYVDATDRIDALDLLCSGFRPL